MSMKNLGSTTYPALTLELNKQFNNKIIELVIDTSLERLNLKLEDLTPEELLDIPYPEHLRPIRRDTWIFDYKFTLNNNIFLNFKIEKYMCFIDINDIKPYLSKYFLEEKLEEKTTKEKVKKI